MSEQKWVFIEAWADVGLDIPYILLLICKSETSYQIIDPREQNRVLFSTELYEEAKLWLLEDEYRCFDGRLQWISG